mmetsp:Transcript_3731/g.7392  ORF Transcript_3731/g.7392 Transcript_3731/m.7392 type:complete len:666 (-) Transcript_3731:350-2347(-)|eukprot:CAMPEP_0172865154 /NCGR_PEP_ID=MMETSP1075-20121228/81236_1 /TAXON_ID=2916 /ORGANISM="Ceratium fusus, Strain PA161109" /LENGTH=665 /DNA_ID=CAMNT_0013714145 /DNA_START=79 /DNA_END=2076 /DNA_ORIENTATION=+
MKRHMLARVKAAYVPSGGCFVGNRASLRRPLHSSRVSCCGRWILPANAGNAVKSRQLLQPCGQSGRRFASQVRHPYYPSDPKDDWCVDTELYLEVFQPFGVSKQQFNILMGHGTRVKGIAGADVVKGGALRNTVTIVIRGDAVAYNPGDRSRPQCKYVGKIGSSSADGSVAMDAETHVPTRGSVIGGSAMVDKHLMTQPFPFDIVAVTPIEFIEWDTTELREFINSKGWHAVQASFYYVLYYELVNTINKDKAASLSAAFKDDAKHSADAVVRPPSTRQLLQLSVFIAVPFFGFGFADNAIMLVCGDAIDANFCVAFGFSTLAAAGLGNWISDVVGLSLGDAIERWAARLGLSDGKLTPPQRQFPVAKAVASISKIVGISLGCFAGMIPLLFRTPNKIEFSQKEFEIFDQVFSPTGVSTSQFVGLMEKATMNKVQTGGVMLRGGQPCNKVILLLHGEAEAYAHPDENSNISGKKSAMRSYSGAMDEHAAIISKGSVIGGSALADPSITSNSFPCDVVATSQVEWIEWTLSDLQELMEAEPAICASLYSLLYKELHRSVSVTDISKRLDQYRGFLAAVLVDDHLNETERKFIEDHRDRLSVSDQEHAVMLAEQGWTLQDWKQGRRSGPPTQAAQLVTLETGVQQLQSVVEMMQSTIRQLQREGREA